MATGGNDGGDRPRAVPVFPKPPDVPMLYEEEGSSEGSREGTGEVIPCCRILEYHTSCCPTCRQQRPVEALLQNFGTLTEEQCETRRQQIESNRRFEGKGELAGWKLRDQDGHAFHSLRIEYYHCFEEKLEQFLIRSFAEELSEDGCDVMLPAANFIISVVGSEDEPMDPNLHHILVSDIMLFRVAAKYHEFSEEFRARVVERSQNTKEVRIKNFLQSFLEVARVLSITRLTEAEVIAQCTTLVLDKDYMEDIDNAVLPLKQGLVTDYWQKCEVHNPWMQLRSSLVMMEHNGAKIATRKFQGAVIFHDLFGNDIDDPEDLEVLSRLFMVPISHDVNTDCAI